MSAPYFLAIDIGTSRTSAAIARSAPDGSLMATPFPLGRSSDNAPTVVFASDGELLFGDAAERRGHTQPDRLIREYKRRIGDDVPILVADHAYAPEDLYALTVDWAARAVVEREGATPVRLAITVPAAWGDYRSGLVRAALEAQGWRDVVVISEPEAAARHYEATNPLVDGRVLAVYDFGGGTFDAVALRKESAGAVRIVGAPAGIPDLGGADFDDAIVRHVARTAQIDAATLAGTSSGRMALAALRRECVDAKESLSFDSEAVVPVLVGAEHRSVRLSRDEFELMIADDLERTVDAFQDALDAAGVDHADIDAILLTGGTSRIPRVAQVLSDRFDCPIALDADPKAIIALGAARAASDAAQAAAAVAADAADEDDAAIAVLDSPAPAAATPRRGWFRRVPSGAYVTVGAAVLITGLGLAGAPALGTGMVTASERSGMTAEPVVSDEDGAGSPAVTDAEEPADQGTDPVADGPAPETKTPPRAPAKKPTASPTAKRTPATSPGSGTSTAATTTKPSASTPGGSAGTTQSGGQNTPPTNDAGAGSADPDSGETDPGDTGATGGDPGGDTGGGDTGGETGTGGGETGGGDTGGGDTGTGGDTGGGDTGGGDTGGGDTGTGGGETSPPAEPDPETPPPAPEPSPTPAAISAAV
jgi:actin-like ATPase involved in cell morphogenesis